MTRILIRTDAPARIGVGHVLRCLTLGDALARHDAAICFVGHLSFHACQTRPRSRRRRRADAARESERGFGLGRKAPCRRCRLHGSAPAYRESASRVLLEVPVMEKPIVATDVPGCRKIVDHGVTGLLCEPRSPEDLQGALARMANLADEERRRMDAASRETNAL